MQNKFHKSVQNFIVNTYGVAVVRNMAPKGKNKGYLDNIREFLKEIDLADIGKADPPQFPQILNDQTEKLRQHMPRGARHWGTARKCLNLFFRGALYNFYIRKEYGLEKFEKYMEIPLDSYVGKELRKEDRGLPRWDAVIRLTPEVSSSISGGGFEGSQTARDGPGASRCRLLEGRPVTEAAREKRRRKEQP